MNPDKLFNYLDGKLSGEEREKFEDQLLQDPQLQREFTVARKIHERMSGPAREVVLDEPDSNAMRGRQIMRRVMIVFLALIFINTLAGVIGIGLLQSKRRQTAEAANHNRQDVALALQKAAANALPTPSLEVDEIKLPAAPNQQDAVFEKISAAAKQASGSAAKNLSNENGTLVFAEIPAAGLKQFRDSLAQLGAVVPPSDSSTPAGGKTILQIRITPRSQ